MFKPINGWTKEAMIQMIIMEYKGQAISENGTCQYLTEDGKKCAVGCFIPDGHPGQFCTKAISENDSSTNDLLYYCSDLKNILPLDREGLVNFQRFHDGMSRSLEDMIQWIELNVEG